MLERSRAAAGEGEMDRAIRTCGEGIRMLGAREGVRTRWNGCKGAALVRERVF